MGQFENFGCGNTHEVSVLTTSTLTSCVFPHLKFNPLPKMCFYREREQTFHATKKLTVVFVGVIIQSKETVLHQSEQIIWQKRILQQRKEKQMADYKERFEKWQREAKERFDDFDKQLGLKDKIEEGAKVAADAAKKGAETLKEGAQKIKTEAEKSEVGKQAVKVAEGTVKTAEDAAKKA